MTTLQDKPQGLLSGQRWVMPLAWLLAAIGAVSRLAPLTDPHGRLLRQFMIEDGYYMQTVARNLGIGLGLSISDGTVQTNGVQPLATYVFALPFWLSGGDKVAGIAGVELLSVLVSIAAAWLFYTLVRKVLRDTPDARPLAALVAALWFASPAIVKHSMNGLETGIYLLVSLATVNLFLNFVESSPSRLKPAQMLGLGVMLGLCFLARNDAAFLIAALLLSRVLLAWPVTATQWRERIVETAVPGLISVLIAVPWLIYNYRLFGSIVPISGIAESLGAHFGQNLPLVPALLFEYVSFVIQIPWWLEAKWPVMLVSGVVAATVLILGVTSLWSKSRSARYMIVIYTIFAICLIGFYGLFFGVEFFMSRYLSAVSPFIALLSILAAYRLLLLMAERWRAALLPVAAGLCVVAIAAHNLLIYRYGLRHGHFQVVGWVQRNVPPGTWVGAIQTGTLGFFYDRTVNLDGKVNPGALRAKLDEGGTVIPYVVRSNIVYLADWNDLSKWSKIDEAGFNRAFELIVTDPNANLAVFKRIGPAGAGK